MKNKISLALTEKTAKAYVGGHSNDVMSPTIGSYVLATEKEIRLAEKLKKHIPWQHQ